MKIIADSSANLERLQHTPFTSVPIKINIADREFLDTPDLDVDQLLREMDASTGRSSTACPSIGDWLQAFGQEETIFAAVLTSKLSGSYNAASIAAKEYISDHPDRWVCIHDTHSTGPEMELVLEKYDELAGGGVDFGEACQQIRRYNARTHLAFMLVSLDNFARNGRVNPALAKIVRLLNIRIVGRGSDDGDLEPLNKCRGQHRAVEQVWKNMHKAGYTGGRVRIRHTENPAAAEELAGLIRKKYPAADVKIAANRGLCAYYAEHGGMLVGYEGAVQEPARQEEK